MYSFRRMVIRGFLGAFTAAYLWAVIMLGVMLCAAQTITTAAEWDRIAITVAWVCGGIAALAVMGISDRGLGAE